MSPVHCPASPDGFGKSSPEIAAPPGTIGEISALVYLATKDNPHFAGPASDAELVRQISSARGESGDNVDYVLELDAALAHYGVIEPPLRALADRLRAPSPDEPFRP